jgi:NADH-quinone oxidoreductase subunit K
LAAKSTSAGQTRLAAGRKTRLAAGGEARLMDVAWFVVLSAFIFCIGAAGVMTRRSPLVVLLCLELMLNAGNLALIAFARMVGNQEGQIFALIVMVVAACEVVIGLGVIVAMYRRRLPIDVDEMAELRG